MVNLEDVSITLNNMEILMLLIIILQLKMVGLIKIITYGGVMKILSCLNLLKQNLQI